MACKGESGAERPELACPACGRTVPDTGRAPCLCPWCGAPVCEGLIAAHYEEPAAPAQETSEGG